MLSTSCPLIYMAGLMLWAQVVVSCHYVIVDLGMIFMLMS